MRSKLSALQLERYRIPSSHPWFSDLKSTTQAALTNMDGIIDALRSISTLRQYFIDEVNARYALERDLSGFVYDHVVQQEVDPIESILDVVTVESGTYRGSNNMDIVIVTGDKAEINGNGGDDSLVLADNLADFLAGTELLTYDGGGDLWSIDDNTGVLGDVAASNGFGSVEFSDGTVLEAAVASGTTGPSNFVHSG